MLRHLDADDERTLVAEPEDVDANKVTIDGVPYLPHQVDPRIREAWAKASRARRAASCSRSPGWRT